MDITLQNFREHIEEAVITRGEKYYESGAIFSLKEQNPGEFVAIVRGNDSYHVRVILDEEDIIETSCGCPYNKGPICKHRVAVLCALEDGKRDILNSVSSRDSAKIVDEKVRAMSREDLLQIVESARKGGNIDRIVKTTYVDKVQWENKEYVKGIVRESVEQAKHHYGGITYGNTQDAVQGAADVLRYAEEFERSSPRAAAVCAEAVIEVLSPTLMRADDSDGDINGTISAAFELLSRVACAARDSGNESLRTEILSCALKEWPKKKYEGWDCPEMFLEIAADLVVNQSEETSFERALRHYTSLREKESHLSTSADDGFVARYRHERVAKLYARMLERLHPDRLDEFLKTHLDLYPMRTAAIERAFLRNDIAEARRLAREGAKQAEKDNYPGHVSDFLDALMRAAERAGDMREAYEIAVQQFLSYHIDSFSYYRKAKQYAGSTWSECRAGIIKILGDERKGRYGDIHRLADVYVEEGMWDELLKLVEQNPALASSYGKRLEKRYPKEIARVYAEDLNKNMDFPGGRDIYRVQCEMLSKIRKLGCPEIADRIIKEWREKYPRRRALMEELDRLYK